MPPHPYAVAQHKPSEKPSTIAGNVRDDDQASLLIAHYAARAGQRLTMFGAPFFNTTRQHQVDTPNIADPISLGQIDNGYRLGPGDELVVRLRGSTNRTIRTMIDQSGQVVLDDLLPVMAAGETLGDFRQQLEAEVSRRFLDTEAFISLDKLRTIAVSVTGAVNAPGPVRLNSLATPLDALQAAGGVQLLGSLRRIQWHKRDGQEPASLDLYDYLLGDDQGLAQATLRNGDQLHVPPLGPTLAIAGGVKRPAIFELPDHGWAGQVTIDASEAMRLSGGPLYPGAHQVVLSRLNDDGLERQTVLDPTAGTSLRDGDLILWQIPQAITQGGIGLVGHTSDLGTIPLDQAMSLGRLLQRPGVVRPDTYGWLGLIERRQHPSGQTSYLPFAPETIMMGKRDRRLQDRDRVILFPAHLFPLAGPEDARGSQGGLAAADHGLDGSPGRGVGARGADDRDSAARDSFDGWLAEHDLADAQIAQLIQGLGIDIGGAVQRPGRYPVADTLSAQTALALAGNAQPGSKTTGLQLTTYRQEQYQRQELNADQITLASIEPGDALYLSADIPASSRLVTITGAVKQPGRYPVAPGERLSSLITRAGGLTAQAFADGAIFTRASERRQEANRNQRAARELDQAMARLLTRQDDDVDSNLVEMSQRLADELRDAETLGRITVEADPSMLLQRPDLDVLLQAGDRVFYPEQTVTVRVSGEVQSPSALQFESGKTASDYMRDAGGFTALADKSRSFVVYPDGSARPLRVSQWNYDPMVILPGSTIVAPRDPKPFDAVELTANIGNILSQIAVTAASIAVIADDDD
ncbi:MAG: SLBB domain-containing protein [Pseudomonadota bacterium]